LPSRDELKSTSYVLPPETKGKAVLGGKAQQPILLGSNAGHTTMAVATMQPASLLAEDHLAIRLTSLQWRPLRAAQIDEFQVLLE
jgi:hypothetical protein